MPLSSDEQTKYKALYLKTARQYVKDMQDNLAQLLTGNETKEVIDSFHLEAHSLKGQSQIMGYQSMSTISSIIEKIFYAKKENKLVLSQDLLAKLPDAVNALQECLDSIDKSNEENDVSPISETLQSLVNISE